LLELFLVSLFRLFLNTVVNIHIYIYVYICIHIYIYIYIFIYMCMDALVSRYLTSLSLGPFCSIGWSMHREVVGGARVREGGDGGGGGAWKSQVVFCIL
jgi:hypothetical protein